MKETVISLILLTFSIICGEGLPDLDVIQKVDDGFINWTQKTVTITGTGVPDLSVSNVNSARLSAEKSAKNNALYRFSKALSKISLKSGKTLEKYLNDKKETDFLREIENRSQWSEMNLSNYYSDGSVDYAFKFSIDQQIQDILEKTSSEAPVDSVKSEEPVPQTVEMKSFVVIDLKKLKMDTALYPSIETADGKTVISLKNIFYIRKTPDTILEKNNAPADYLSIVPKRIKDKSKIIVSKQDAVKIRTQLKPDTFSEGRVIIVFK